MSFIFTCLYSILRNVPQTNIHNKSTQIKSGPCLTPQTCIMLYPILLSLHAAQSRSLFFNFFAVCVIVKICA